MEVAMKQPCGSTKEHTGKKKEIDLIASECPPTVTAGQTAYAIMSWDADVPDCAWFETAVSGPDTRCPIDQGRIRVLRESMRSKIANLLFDTSGLAPGDYPVEVHLFADCGCAEDTEQVSEGDPTQQTGKGKHDLSNPKHVSSD